MHDKPVLLFYCQHSLGIGHLTRSFALCRPLAQVFRVVFLNGGPIPEAVPVPSEIEIVHLPPLGMDDGHTVISREAGTTVEDARARRRSLILEAVERHRPAVLLVELFPFGRKKFAGEILAMIRAARRANDRLRTVCSLRDILVHARPDQRKHDDRARWLTDRYFDAVLVHADPALARLEETFHPSRAMRTPVYYTGLVVPQRAAQAPLGAAERGRHVLVSAGGGIVGGPLFRAVLDAHRWMLQHGRAMTLRFVAGPFLPELDWLELQQRAALQPGVEVVRQVSDLAGEMRRAAGSISQCGYNTALDVIVAGVPALMLPYAAKGETEQTDRAQRLAALGAVRCAALADLTPETLAAAIESLPRFEPTPAAISLDGAERSAQLIAALLGQAVQDAGSDEAARGAAVLARWRRSAFDALTS
jgi:predicted glycosyltransferase